MFLVIINLIDQSVFETQLSSCTGVFIFVINFSMIYLYCKYTGLPYKSTVHYKGVKHAGCVVIYWTLAFLIKFGTSPIDALNPGVMNAHHKTKPEQNKYDLI